MEYKIIKEYEYFESGSLYLEFYEGTSAKGFYKQLSKEIDALEGLELILKKSGASHFKLCFNKTSDNLNKPKEGQKNDIRKS